MHLDKMFRVMGCLVSGREGWVFWISLSREVCELAI